MENVLAIASRHTQPHLMVITSVIAPAHLFQSSQKSIAFSFAMTRILTLFQVNHLSVLLHVLRIRAFFLMPLVIAHVPALYSKLTTHVLLNVQQTNMITIIFATHSAPKTRHSTRTLVIRSAQSQHSFTKMCVMTSAQATYMSMKKHV